jgi:hypothetical protein
MLAADLLFSLVLDGDAAAEQDVFQIGSEKPIA